jgi:hypothetical protein
MRALVRREKAARIVGSFAAQHRLAQDDSLMESCDAGL